MLVRFYMSPPANPGGLAFSRPRNRKDRSDFDFSIAPIHHIVNGTYQEKSTIRNKLEKSVRRIATRRDAP
jgi:hypothetical protein